MRPYSIVQAPALAFYSRDFYREVASRWRGMSSAYLLFLLAVCCLPPAYQIQAGWAKFVDDQGSKLVEQIPPITITQGTVTVDAEQPCYITDTDTRKVLAIIDTTGQVTSLDRTGAVVFIGKDQAVVRHGANETRIYSLSRVEQFHIDRGVARVWLNRSRYVAGPFLYLMVLAGSYVYRLLEVLVLALIGLAISGGARAGFKFGGLLGVAVLAVTPSIVVKTVLDLAKVTLPMSWLVFLMIAPERSHSHGSSGSGG